MTTQAVFSPGVTGLLTPLQDFMDDAEISEILINRPKEVFIEKAGKMIRFDIPVLTAQYLRRLFLLIANENQQSLIEQTPVLSGNLADGSRVQLVIPPASRYETLSIRKFITQQIDFDTYAEQQFFQSAKPFLLKNTNSILDERDTLQTLYEANHWQTFISKAIEDKKNIIIAGATASGKTTFLNSCINHIPVCDRLITLEDTFEIQVTHPNVVHLKAPKTLSNQASLISMQDLVQASLRLRPDRIIMGEIRGPEIFDFIAACSTGHNGSLATIHANNPNIAFMRMAQLYKLNAISGMGDEDIYRELHAVIDIIVQLKKTDQGRRLTEVYYKDAR